MRVDGRTDMIKLTVVALRNFAKASNAELHKFSLHRERNVVINWVNKEARASDMKYSGGHSN